MENPKDALYLIAPSGIDPLSQSYILAAKVHISDRDFDFDEAVKKLIQIIQEQAPELKEKASHLR